jgi:hypothetical protein
MELMDAEVMSSGRISSVTLSGMKQGWYNVNKFLVFLLPCLASLGSLAMMRYGNLMHIGAIMGVAKVYDLFQKLPDIEEQSVQECWLDGDHPKTWQPESAVLAFLTRTRTAELSKGLSN